MTTIGVLALQGDVREHLRALEGLGVTALGVRRPEELDVCDGLILPGGESTTMAKLATVIRRLRPSTSASAPVKGAVSAMAAVGAVIMALMSPAPTPNSCESSGNSACGE